MKLTKRCMMSVLRFRFQGKRELEPSPDSPSNVVPDWVFEGPDHREGEDHALF